MRISIAIGAYEMFGRGADFLRRCLDSVASQRNVDLDIVVSDHSVGDDLVTVCRSFPSVKYVRNPLGRGSSSANFNCAIDNSVGDLVKVLCQDDCLFDSSSLERTVEAFWNKPDAQWLVTQYYHTRDLKSFLDLHTPSMSCDLPFENAVGTHSGLTIRGSVGLRFDENLIWLMDCEYYYRLRKTYGDPIILRSPTVVQTLWPGQVTNTIADATRRKNEHEYLNKLYRNGSQK